MPDTRVLQGAGVGGVRKGWSEKDLTDGPPEQGETWNSTNMQFGRRVASKSMYWL